MGIPVKFNDNARNVINDVFFGAPSFGGLLAQLVARVLGVLARHQNLHGFLRRDELPNAVRTLANKKKPENHEEKENKLKNKKQKKQNKTGKECIHLLNEQHQHEKKKLHK